MELDTLIVPLKLDTKEFENGVKKAQTLGDRLQTGLERIGNRMTSIGKGMSAITAGVGGAILGVLKGTQDWTDTVDGLGDVLGTSAEDSSALAFAIQRVGGDVGALGGQMAFLGKNLVDARGQMGSSGQALADMGIQFRDSNGHIKPTSEILQLVADKVAAMPDGLEKTKVMMELFGKSGKDLSDTMGALANGGLEQARDKVEKYGLLMTQDKIDKQIEFGKAIEEMKLAGQGLATVLGSELAPVLTPLLTQLTDEIPGIIEKLKEWKEKFDDLPEPIRNTVVWLAVMLVTVGPLLLLSGQLATTIGTMSTAFKVLAPLIVAAKVAMEGFALWTLTAAIGSNIPFISTLGTMAAVLFAATKGLVSWGIALDTIKIGFGIMKLQILAFLAPLLPIVLLIGAIVLGVTAWWWIGQKLFKLFEPLRVKLGFAKDFAEALEWINQQLDKFSWWVVKLIGQLGQLKLPWWITPGSPTPLEIGLKGINSAMRTTSKQFSATFNATQNLEPVKVINFNYAPTISLASRDEAERILKPMIKQAMR